MTAGASEVERVSFDCYRGSGEDGEYLDFADWARNVGNTLAELETEILEMTQGKYVLGQFGTIMRPWRPDYYQEPCG